MSDIINYQIAYSRESIHFFRLNNILYLLFRANWWAYLSSHPHLQDPPCFQPNFGTPIPPKSDTPYPSCISPSFSQPQLGKYAGENLNIICVLSFNAVLFTVIIISIWLQTNKAMNIYLFCRLRTEVQASGLSTNYNIIIVTYYFICTIIVVVYSPLAKPGRSRQLQMKSIVLKNRQ